MLLQRNFRRELRNLKHFVDFIFLTKYSTEGS